MEKSELAKAVLRLGVGAIFLTFGIWQLINPTSWIGYISGYVYSFGISVSLIIVLNGILDLVIGLSLLSGVGLEFFSLIGVLRILVIAFSLGFNDVFVRDIGIAFALFAVYLNGKDKFCLKI